MAQAALLCKYELIRNVLSKDTNAGKTSGFLSCACCDVVFIRQGVRYLKFNEEHSFAESLCLSVPTSKMFNSFVFSHADCF